jgi:hypothetical protein
VPIVLGCITYKDWCLHLCCILQFYLFNKVQQIK